MSRQPNYLKASWAQQHFERLMPLLDVGASVALLWGTKRLAACGEFGSTLTETTAGVRMHSLTVEGEVFGALLLYAAPGSPADRTDAWGRFLLHGLQGQIDAMHARHAVAKEALESYREMALLQRAVGELNSSLKPAMVAAALLKDFDGRNDKTEFGAVFLHNAEHDGYNMIQSFGENAVEEFAGLVISPLFDSLAGHGNGDILNDLTQSPQWATELAGFQSLLWHPLAAHNENLGFLVLASRHVDAFSAADMKLAQTLVPVAASALHNAQLYEAQQTMFQSFVRVISAAVDAKSPYTAGHCRRVPELAMMLAEKAHQTRRPPFSEFALTEDDLNAVELAAMLHDCGKVVTPEWVVDKATKLDAIVNRLDLVALRIELMRRDVLITHYRAVVAGQPGSETECQDRLQQLDEQLAFLETCNKGGEFISPDHVARIQTIAALRWTNARGEELPLLNDNEVYNLCTPRGTLNPEERKIIEDHALHTIRMLSEIPFPRPLRNVTEYAGGHHERMDGKGYPYGLKGEQLSIPARIIAIADIFEALTAPDRPYRKGGTVSWAVDIMHRMKKDGHIDADLFDLFLAEGVYLHYSEKYLAPGQRDQVDLPRYLG